MSIDIVEDLTPRVQYVASAAQTVFAYPFAVFQESDLVAYVDGVLKILSTHYTVTGETDDLGGDVTFLVPMIGGEIVTLYRDTTIERTTDLQQNGPLASSTLNDELDKLYVIAQEQRNALLRAMRLSPIDTSLDGDLTLPLKAARAGKYQAFDANGLPIASAGTGNDSALRTDLAASTGALLVAYVQSGVGAIPRAIRNPLLECIYPEDFGAVGDGVTNDTTPLQRAATAAVGKRMVLSTGKTYIYSAAIPIGSGTTVDGYGATLKTTTTNVACFTATSKANMRVRGVFFVATTAGATAHVGPVVWIGCTDSTVELCDMSGCQCHGVELNGTARCTVQDNYFHGFLGSVQDSSDVAIYNAATLNVVTRNRCFGGNDCGVLVQDPLTGLVPTKNKVFGNQVGQHKAYGIVNYIGGPGGVGDSWNEYYDNDIEDIQGSAATNRSSGAGFYSVGGWTGGTRVYDNRIRNCCVQTLDRMLAPAGIGFTGIKAGVEKPYIGGNSIDGMTQGDGILIVLSPGGVVLGTNRVRIPSTNNATGAGGGTLVGSGIRIESASNVTLAPQDAECAGTGQALFIFATVAQSDITVTGGEYVGSIGAPVRVDQAGGFTTANLLLDGVRAKQTGNTSNAFQLASIAGGSMPGCVGTAGTQPALAVTACTDFDYLPGKFSNTANPVITTSGVCTNSRMAVNFGTSATGMQNGGTGCAVTWRANAAPATGTWAVGDTTEQSVPVVGNPKRWRCTVAGNPGTWVSEGNL